MLYILFKDGKYLSSTVIDGQFWTDKKQSATLYDKKDAQRLVLNYPGSRLLEVKR